MTNYVRPANQRPQNWLANLRSLATANAAASTEYTVIYPQRESGDTRRENERGETQAIIGDLRFDHRGNETGIVPEGGRAVFGHAVYNTTTKKLERVQ